MACVKPLSPTYSKKNMLDDNFILNKYPLGITSLVIVNGSVQKTKQNKPKPHTLSFWYIWTNIPGCFLDEDSQNRQRPAEPFIMVCGAFLSMLDLKDNLAPVTPKFLNATSMKRAKHKHLEDRQTPKHSKQNPQHSPGQPRLKGSRKTTGNPGLALIHLGDFL